jgi:hypothetical protein
VKWLACIGLLLAIAGGPAQAQKGGGDVFKGKLFPPNIVLEHKDELGLTKAQFTAIRAAVVKVQANVAEHEWDLGVAYQEVMAELDNTPVDGGKVLEHIEAVLAAENEVKKLQVAMLVELRNLLTEEQMDYLRDVKGY